MMDRVKGLTVSPGSLHEYILERDMTADKVYTFRFTVIGKGTFPFDMLRYDRCFPHSTNDAGWINESDRQRHIVLVSQNPRKLWMPTFERWRSFGWVVKSTVWERST